MAAHPQISDVVEKDHAAGIAGVDWRAQKGAYQHFRAARLVDDRPSPRVVRLAEAMPALRHVTRTEIGAAADDHSRGLAAGVGIDDARRYGWRVSHPVCNDTVKSFGDSRRR